MKLLHIQQGHSEYRITLPRLEEHVMFEWLKEEMSQIKTNKFFLMEGKATSSVRAALKKTNPLLPPSYKKFALQFGNAELYRRNSYYYVTVFAVPRAAQNAKGERLIHFGRTWTSWAYFKESLLVKGGESPVFQGHHQGSLQKTADGFEEWLRKKCQTARKRYRKKEWQAIENGPPPFNSEEIRIVNARCKFHWQVVGIAKNGDFQFEVHNGSGTVLPYLSIGIRLKGGEEFGGIRLPVSAIHPGETKIIEMDCYKESHDPNSIEAFEEPEPGPEDREQYWEFR